jgi:hypothetical protein
VKNDHCEFRSIDIKMVRPPSTVLIEPDVEVTFTHFGHHQMEVVVTRIPISTPMTTTTVTP